MKHLKLLAFLFLFQLSACANNPTTVETSSKALSGNIVIERNPHNNTVRYLKLNDPNFTQNKSQDLKEVSLAFLETYRSEFLLANPREEFDISSVKKDDLGYTRIKLKQKYKGLPVWNSVISIQFNPKNSVQLINGQYFPTPSNINTNSGLSPSELFQKLKLSVNSSNYVAQKIIFYKDNKTPRLAYLLKPNNQVNLIGNELIVDAQTAETLNSISSIQTLR